MREGISCKYPRGINAVTHKYQIATKLRKLHSPSNNIGFNLIFFIPTSGHKIFVPPSPVLNHIFPEIVGIKACMVNYNDL